MQMRFVIEKPDEAEATMKITMTVREWRELGDQLKNEYPSWRLGSAINRLVSHARKVYYAENEDDPQAL